MNKIRTIGIALFTLALIALSVGSADAQSSRDSLTTRFPNGITNTQQGKLFGDSLIPDRTKVFEYFNDFQKQTDNPYVSAAYIYTVTTGVVTATASQTAWDWTVTSTATGTPTRSILNAAAGILCVTNGTADNDVQSFQLTSETFKFVSGKKLWFKARINLATSATQSDFYAGLMVADTSIVASSPADWVAFKKDDGDANLDFTVKKDASPTEAAAITTLSRSTWYTLGFYYDGDARINYFVDDVFYGASATTNMPDDEELCATFLIQNGEASASSLYVDYIYVVQER